MIRNPIYTGIICGFFATFIIFGTLASLLAFGIILILYILKINKEQKFLLLEFGDEFDQYMKRSWALIPFLF
ncbi:methyltransferase family protein [Acetobacterium paludosum]|uniref:methyltransferase family protein n=1 Tax=Acetobacterium paludosum TaxID=52693 RepID=UPI001FAA9411|nr:methyltransferase [Acetobacterium paludosum]